MKTILTDNPISFKDFEMKIFDYVCQFGRELTQSILGQYDERLLRTRNTKEYRCKGKRKTTIKTVYGEVEYSRNVYEKKLEDGTKHFIYLLDEAVGMEKIGTVSTNLAQKIAHAVTEAPFRVTADLISETLKKWMVYG